MSKKPKVKTFKGFVNSVQGDTAFVSLKDKKGTSYEGTCQNELLTKKGINAGEPFRCKVIGSGKNAKVKFKPAKKKLSKKRKMKLELQMHRTIGAEIVKSLASFLHDLHEGKPIPCTRVIREGNEMRVEHGVLGSFDPPSEKVTKRPAPKKVAKKKAIKGSRK